MPTWDTPLAAALIALIIALVKVIERLIDWGSKKLGGKETKEKGVISVKLDPEVSKLIKETADEVREVKNIINRIDSDGTPMVYSSRRQIETLGQVVNVIRDIATTQVRLAAGLDRLEEKFTEHDKQDAITFHKVGVSLARVENQVEDSRDLLMKVGKDHEAALEHLDSIQKDIRDHDRRTMEEMKK